MESIDDALITAAMDDLDGVNSLVSVATQSASDLMELLGCFIINTLVVWIIVRFMYYPRCHRKDYFFTYMLISVSIFLLIFLLGSVKVKIGFALGLFAIFGIIRYRTESMPVREMTYLFVIISLSVVNAFSATFTLLEMIVINLLVLVSIGVFEIDRWSRHKEMCNW